MARRRPRTTNGALECGSDLSTNPVADDIALLAVLQIEASVSKMLTSQDHAS
ncbi:hypothetical protein FHT91_003950 [Rhizobium sp. BK347]|nr:hypothetical protein [Rhizobium sp. BK252]MBB3403707.1 hypothetical protein [Rhizobium sp. BK289]MBB3416107.1 hypothetical protein [Rhizobium sp. BK284]MBB3484171.1 hypothetical protein [Rhizobium sp. BK347]